MNSQNNNDLNKNISPNLDLEQAQQHEAERRKQLLGPCADMAEFDYDKFSGRAFQVMVPLTLFKAWWFSYQHSGIKGLTPTDWLELDEDAAQLVLTRFQLIAHLVTDGVISRNKIGLLSVAQGWSYRTAERWVARYQVGGLWGLAPNHNPFKDNRREKTPPPDLAALSEHDLQIVYERREQLGPLADMACVSNALVAAHASEAGLSPRTLRQYWRNYRDYGLAGLVPHRRSDTNKHHNISDRMIEIIRAIRLSKTKATVSDVYDIACKRAKALGENEPSKWQVRRICEKIPRSTKLLADGNNAEFTNTQRITYPLKFSDTVYLMDHTLIDILVKDLRRKGLRKPSGEVRPWLTLVIEAQSRVIVAAQFGYDQPSRHTVAAALREAFLDYGLPHEIWVDRGKDFVSGHVGQLVRSLDIDLRILPPKNPQLKGRAERFFRTLNTRLWSTLSGYVGSNTTERNPTVKAELTIDQVVANFWEFIEKYHHETHSVLKTSPITYWHENCFTEPVDPRKLDILLYEPERRKVTKEGISYSGMKYWHSDLAVIVNESVLIRADTRYGRPDEIEVFWDGQWFCTAFSIESDRGKEISAQNVREAQRNQRAAARTEIKNAKNLLAEVDAEIAEQHNSLAANQSTAESKKSPNPQPTRTEKKPDSTGKGKRPVDILQHIANKHDTPPQRVERDEDVSNTPDVSGKDEKK